jgi:GNAT superfamily N-acetyltransferase
MNQLFFHKATINDLSTIWKIIQGAIERRKKDGSNQWQDGYPNLSVLENDITNGNGFVLVNANEIVGYCAILINDEPEYERIVGKWITDSDFVVYHRVAIAEEHLGKGYAKKMLRFIEEFAIQNGIYSIKVDTNFDNAAMLKLLTDFEYVYCGEVYFRGSARKAFEKVVNKA